MPSTAVHTHSWIINDTAILDRCYNAIHESCRHLRCQRGTCTGLSSSSFDASGNSNVQSSGWMHSLILVAHRCRDNNDEKGIAVIVIARATAPRRQEHQSAPRRFAFPLISHFPRLERRDKESRLDYFIKIIQETLKLSLRKIY